MRDLDATAVLIRAAEASGMPQRLLEAARAEILELVAVAGLVDRRRLETFRLGLQIDRLRRAGRTRSQIRERLAISPDQFDRASCAVRVAYDQAEFQLEQVMDLKSTSLGIGAGTPAPMSKYGSAKRPTAPKGETPRDGGGMSDGTTAGNYNGDYMANVTVNGIGKADAAAESAQEQFEENGQ